MQTTYGYEISTTIAGCDYATANPGRFLYRLRCAGRRAQLRKRVAVGNDSIAAAHVGMPCPICGSGDAAVTLHRESDGVVRFGDMGCRACGAC